MINSQILYFVETSPLKERIFNSYMDEAVMLYNEQFKAEAINEWDKIEGYCGFYPIFLVGFLNKKWQVMVRDN